MSSDTRSTFGLAGRIGSAVAIWIPFVFTVGLAIIGLANDLRLLLGLAVVGILITCFAVCRSANRDAERWKTETADERKRRVEAEARLSSLSVDVMAELVAIFEAGARGKWLSELVDTLRLLEAAAHFSSTRISAVVNRMTLFRFYVYTNSRR